MPPYQAKALQHLNYFGTRFILKIVRTTITTHYVTEKTKGNSLVSIYNKRPVENYRHKNHRG